MSNAASDTTTDEAVATAAGPIASTERFVSIDMLRGVAILGILVMNIYAFAMPFAAYGNPLVMGGTEPQNIGTWFFTHFFFDQKFLSIFAMLFGAGLVLMAGRAERRGAKPARMYYRRQFWLLVIGAVHAYLIWMGDILFAYALMGMLAYLFRNRAVTTLVVVGVVLISITMAMSYGFSFAIKDMQEEGTRYAELAVAGEELDEEQQATLDEWNATRQILAPTAEDVRSDIDAYSGGYLRIVEHRVPIVLGMQQGALFFYGWRILGLMLIGMALMKSGVLTCERSANFYRKLMLGGYIVGLPLTVYSGLDLFAHEFEPIYVLRFGGFANAIGSIVVALGHIGMVMLIVKTGYLQSLMQRFAAAGRMALTNYLMHSVILTTVFYGYGLGLYGQIPRFTQMGFVVAVIGLQLLLSPWWLARYRFGPVEWLWRSITYWRIQPMRQRQVSAATR